MRTPSINEIRNHFTTFWMFYFKNNINIGRKVQSESLQFSYNN